MKIGLFLGLTTVDLLFGVAEYPVEDSKTVARRYLAAAGGPATNAAVVFAKLGGTARLVSSIQYDGSGSIALADLEAHAVEHHQLSTVRAASTVLSAIAINEANGSRTILTSPSIHSDAPLVPNSKLLPDLVAGCHVLLLDGHQVDIAIEAARIARRARVPVVLDGDLYRPEIERLLPLVDVVIFGKSFKIPGFDAVPEIINHIQSLGVRHVAATQGSDPIIFLSEGRRGMASVTAARALDTLAAGDFFHGAFCFDFCESHDFETALRFASKVASRSVESWGPREWLRSL